MKKTLVACLIALSLGACNPEAEEVSSSSFSGNKIAYFQDVRTGLCFSMISVSRVDSGGRLSYSVSHSNVPCSEKVEKLLRSNPKSD